LFNYLTILRFELTHYDVICNILTKNEIVVGSDGYITSEGKPIESNAVKLVKFDHPNSVVAFWGLAKHNSWSMRGWLMLHKQQLDKHPEECKSLDDLAFYLKAQLDKTRGPNGALCDVKMKGIGLQVVGFVPLEGDITIQELYLITNVSLDKHGKYYVQQETLDCTPRTIVNFLPPDESELPIEKKRRYIYDQILNSGKIINYNNGDPVLFNGAFAKLGASVKSLPSDSGASSPDYHSRLAEMVVQAIEGVKNHQFSSYSPENVAVGGLVSTGIMLSNGTWLV
jgi:hypothetical protein